MLRATPATATATSTSTAAAAAVAAATPTTTTTTTTTRTTAAPIASYRFCHPTTTSSSQVPKAIASYCYCNLHVFSRRTRAVMPKTSSWEKKTCSPGFGFGFQRFQGFAQGDSSVDEVWVQSRSSQKALQDGLLSV